MNEQLELRARKLMIAAGIGTGAAVGITALRLLVMPLLRDADTGRFSPGIAIVAALAALLLALAVLCRLAEVPRRDVCPPFSMPIALAALFSGTTLVFTQLWDAYVAVTGAASPSSTETGSRIVGAVAWLVIAVGIAAGVALIRWGLQVASEDGTRIGMTTWGLLLPVVWGWLRLARYEMSYASAVGLEESFFDFVMLIFEMLFLFKLARFSSGIGKTRPGMMTFYALATAVTAISAPLTRVGIYFQGDAEAFASAPIAGLEDFGIGLFALLFAWGIACGDYCPVSNGEPETDAPSSVASASPSEDGEDPDSAI